MPMTCEERRKLDDIQLLTYLDGEADRKVARHLAACRHCRARAAELRLTEARLKAAFYRSSCPSPMALGEYRLGTLARIEAARIDRHLMDGCPYCGLELARLERFLGDLAPAPKPDLTAGVAERIRVLVARLTGGVAGALSGSQPALAPAYAGVRGEAAGPAVYEAGDAEVLLAAQPSGAAAGPFELLGLLTGASPAGFTANLWQDAGLAAATLAAAVPVDEGGNFVFSDLAPGTYKLVLSGPDRLIYIED